jgi:hypothetical protein
MASEAREPRSRGVINGHAKPSNPVGARP